MFTRYTIYAHKGTAGFYLSNNMGGHPDANLNELNQAIKELTQIRDELEDRINIYRMEHPEQELV